MGGIARIDGVSYLFMGAPTIVLDVPNGNNGTPSTVQGFEQGLDQTLLEVTPTRSRFHLQGGGVSLVVEFLSPVEPGDLRRQSIPMSYVLMTASSLDGGSHDVQLYFDISGEWTSGDDSQLITWAPSSVPYSGGTLRPGPSSCRTSSRSPSRTNSAAWGSIVWATPDSARLSYQSGQDIVVRAQFVSNGRLTNGNDTNYRAINDNWPVFGFCADLGAVTGSAVATQASIGHVRTPAVSYLGQPLQPLWTAEFATWPDMLAFFHADLPAARKRADRLDARITSAAQQAGGPAYAGLCDIALRQAYGGTERGRPGGEPWAFLKEISSDGNVSTVDVLYPASPAWIYADPGYLALLLEPLLAYAETGGWPGAFAEHDLGSSYPVASGHNNGQEEDMPVEESGNMLIMTAAYLRQASAPARPRSPRPTTRSSSNGPTTWSPTCPIPASRTRPTTSPGSSRTASTWRSRASSRAAMARSRPPPGTRATPPLTRRRRGSSSPTGRSMPRIPAASTWTSPTPAATAATAPGAPRTTPTPTGCWAPAWSRRRSGPSRRAGTTA